MTTSFSLRTLSRDDILHHLPALSEILGKLRQRRRLGELYAAFRAANGDNVLATHCRQRGGRGAHCAGRLRRGGTSRWHRATYHQSTGKPAPSSGCRQIIGSPKCPPPGGSPGALMSELERIARRERKTVLVLDTATGSGAEQFYARCGWEKVGKFRAMR